MRPTAVCDWVAIVNETLARRAWPGKTAVGQRLVLGAGRHPSRSSASCATRNTARSANARRRSSMSRRPSGSKASMWIPGVRPRGPSVLPQVRALIRDMDLGPAAPEAASLEDLTAFTLFPQRLVAWLAAILGASAPCSRLSACTGSTAYNAAPAYARNLAFALRWALAVHRCCGCCWVTQDGLRRLVRPSGSRQRRSSHGYSKGCCTGDAPWMPSHSRAPRSGSARSRSWPVSSRPAAPPA